MWIYNNFAGIELNGKTKTKFKLFFIVEHIIENIFLVFLIK